MSEDLLIRNRVCVELVEMSEERPPVLVERPKTTDIFNGAQCQGYSWAQTHADLEIRIKLKRKVEQNDIKVALSEGEICVELAHSETIKFRRDPGLPSEILVRGVFEHPVDTESACWLLESQEPTIVIYIDKRQEMWWKKLLLEEEVTQEGPKNYSVPMDHLDEGARMAIDKLILEQRMKLTRRNDDISPV